MADENMAMKELWEVLEDLDTLLKHPEVGSELTKKGLNLSLAIVAADALRSYLQGDKKRAHEDFETVAEEIRTRFLTTEGKKDGTS